MNIEEIADQIPSLWDTLDSLTQRMDTLKNTLPVRGQYFNQILEATEVVRCCTCCVILPDEKCSCDCGGDPCQDATTLLRIAPDLMYRTDVTELPQPEMPSLMMGPITQDSAILWQVEVDGQLYPTQVGYQGPGGEGENWLYMEEYLEQNKETLGITGEYLATEMASSNGLLIKNLSTVLKKVRFIPNKTYPNTFMQFSDNPAVSVDATTGVISFCLAAISPEVISCEGASSQVDMLGIWGNFDVYVNGERGLTNQPWNSLETLLFDHFQVKFNMLDENHFVISNQTPENIRMKFVGVGENQPFTAHDINSNPTLHIDNSIPEFLFCLAPQSNLISCDGATNVMSFSSITGRWDIFIDDMEIPAASNTIGSALSQLSLDYLGRISFDYDGFVYIQNQENIPHRLKFVPESDTSFIPNSVDNPSFMPYEDGSFSFCLAPPSNLISCEGATSEIYFPNFSGIWNIEIDGELHLTAGLYVAPYLRENFAHIFEANDDGFMGISNKDSLPHRFKLIPIEDGAYISPSNNPSFMEHEDGSLTFCLAPPEICVALPPVILNLTETFYLYDSNKQYHLYYQDGEGNLLYSEVYGTLLNGSLGYLTPRDLRLDGFEFTAESEGGFDPDYCKAWGFKGDYYITQNKSTWLDSDSIGAFYVEIDGNREYLANSSKAFPHGGLGENLRAVLVPYYESVAAFLRDVGIDAVYNSSLWGSYNSGGVSINMTEGQHSSISFGTQVGYDLKFDGYAQQTCINFKAWSELPNSPSTLIISPVMAGEPKKSCYTLLGNHQPINANSINILTLLGILANYEIGSCFINMPS